MNQDMYREIDRAADAYTQAATLQDREHQMTNCCLEETLYGAVELTELQRQARELIGHAPGSPVVAP